MWHYYIYISEKLIILKMKKLKNGKDLDLEKVSQINWEELEKFIFIWDFSLFIIDDWFS
jgi:hypothetical protein